MDAIEGAAGCMRACMHLESRDKLLKKFTTPFRRNTAMATYEGRSRPEKIARRVQTEYVNWEGRGLYDYITYNKTSNYGTEKNQTTDTGFGLGNKEE